jgi:hypothetical protein
MEDVKMARQTQNCDISPILAAAEHWIKTCLIEDRSVFSQDSRWTVALVDEVHAAFVEHPDFGDNDFITKLKGQMKSGSPAAQQLMAEMLWALLLFPSNMKARTKDRQIREIWALCGQQLTGNHPFLDDGVLVGIGSGGPGFNNFRPIEMEFLIALVRNLKLKTEVDRRSILTNYDGFIDWVGSVPQKGRRQFRHMLRFFAFPNRVERISSDNERRKILEAFAVATPRETLHWTDPQLDDALLVLRASLQKKYPSQVLDFYEPPLREQWSNDRVIKTPAGEISVTVPSDDDEQEDIRVSENKLPDARRSIQIQSNLAKIGAVMGFKVWLPRADRGRVRELVPEKNHVAFLEDLPLNYEIATLDTIEQIDVIWLKGRSIVRAFEVEHTTAVYSGLLRMADLLALQPNMEIHLHIVAPDERREKVFREMKRPVFSLLDRPLSRSCTFISYESVDEMSSLEHLAYAKDGIIGEYEEKAE